MAIAGDDPRTLVSTSWLAAHLNDPDLRILDASWHMPQSARDARAEYASAHIPGARFFDIDDISHQSSDLPHMAPSPEKFMSRMRALGVGDGHQVVVYDSLGLFSAARVWWTFRLMGIESVAVLDGGLPAWQAEGRPVEDLPPIPRERHLTARRQNHLVADVTAVAAAVKLGQPQIVDARPKARFEGAVEEPRAGLRAGHMPGARNLPFPALLAEDGRLLPPAELEARFTEAGLSLAEPIIASCGSGVTAAIIALSAARLGHRDVAVYDGSWAEWGQYDALPLETGPAR